MLARPQAEPPGGHGNLGAMGSGRGFTPQNRGFRLRTQAVNSIIERWPIVCGAGLVIVTLKDSNCRPSGPSGMRRCRLCRWKVLALAWAFGAW